MSPQRDVGHPERGRHEIPTHLGVADQAFAGLSMRQMLSAAAGLALAYGAVSDLPLPLVGRLVVAVVVLAGTLLLVLWRPAGRPLEEWLFVLLRYASAPRVAVWRPRERAVLPPVRHEVVLRAPAPPVDQPQTMKGAMHVAIR